MDNTVDSIQLEIEVSASQAAENVNGLISSLKKLDRLGKSDGLVRLKQNLQGLGRVRLNKLESQLANIEQYVKKLSRVERALRAFDASTPGIDTQETRGSLEELVEEVANAQQEVRSVTEQFGSGQVTETWRDEIKKSCTEMLDGFTAATSEVISARDKLRTVLENKESQFANNSKFQSASTFESSIDDELIKANNQAKILQATFEELSSRGKPPSEEEWRRFENQLVSLNQCYAGLISQANTYNSTVNNLGKTAAGATSLVGKLFNKFKNVMVYRIVRRLLQQISQAAKEGLQNIAQYSEEANKVLSQYKTEGLYLKNSFGSALLPILNALAPTIIRIGDALADILNSIGMITAAISGDKTFVKATKSAQNYAEALNNVNKATLGIDELNILDDKSSSSDTSTMFETVDLSAGDIAASTAKILSFTAAIAGLIILVKGAKVKEFFVTVGKNIKTIWDKMGDMKTWQKVGASIALLGVEAIGTYNAIYDMATGTKSVGEGLLSLVPILAIVGAAMYAMWGPVGLIIAGVVAVISGVVAGIKAVSEAAHDRAMAEFWNVSGVELDKVNGMLDVYFKTINLDKQDEWNQKLEEASLNLIDAAKNYDFLWRSIQNCENIDQNTINSLSDAFNELADAANNLNEAAIQSVMASIRTGIELNITPELTAKLDGLLSSLQTAQDLLNVKVAGLTSQYQKLLNEISQNGGNITDDQKKQLEQLRQDINTFTLTDKTSSYEWELSLQEALQKGVKAGTDRSSLESAINDLNSDRQNYLDIVKKNQATSLSTLSQLWDLDRTEFDGALGIYKGENSFQESEALATLNSSYDAQLAEINKQFNAVIDSIIQNFQNNMMDDPSAWYNDAFAWLYDWGYYGRKDAYNEQKDILEWLKKQKGYATGGQPESGEIFKAREDGIPELVGTIGHRTTVANNTQIIEGIKEGVYEAMTQAQGNGDDGEKVIHLSVNLDGKQVAEVVERYNKRKAVGKTIYAGGVLNGV